MSIRKLHGHAPPPGASLDEVAHGRRPDTTNDNRRPSEKLEDAIIRAAELTGSDGKGKDGLVGYFLFLARRHRLAFIRLLVKVLENQLKRTSDDPAKAKANGDDALETLTREVKAIADRRRQHRDLALQKLSLEERQAVQKYFAMLESTATPPTPSAPKAGSRS